MYLTPCLLRRPSKTAQPLVRADRPKPPSKLTFRRPNRPVNSHFVGLSFTAFPSYFNQPAETADLSSMLVTETCAVAIL